MTRWVVVGGTGKIGRVLCEALSAQGNPVLSISRSFSAPDGCQQLSMNLDPGVSFARVFRSGDRVIYAAGIASRSRCERDPEKALWLNAECPSQMLEAAAEAGAESFTYLSSVKAMTVPAGKLADEKTGEPAKDPYGRTKWLAEQKLLNCDARCRVNIVRPAAVYGFPARQARLSADHWRRRILNLLSVLPVLPANGMRSVISADDLVRAIQLVGASPSCHRQTYIVAEPRFYDFCGIARERGEAPRSSRALFNIIRLLLWPFRSASLAHAFVHSGSSELFSAALIREKLAWGAQKTYGDYLRLEVRQ